MPANDHARRPVNAPADAPRNRPAGARTPVGQSGAPAGWTNLYTLFSILFFSLSQKEKNKIGTIVRHTPEQQVFNTTLNIQEANIGRQD